MDIVYLKLVSGEDIICYVENSDEEYVYVYNPIRFEVKNTPRGSVVRSSKWIPLVKENEFEIKMRDVMIMATPTKDMVDYYHEVLDVLDDLEELEPAPQLTEEQKLWLKNFGSNTMEL